MFPGYEPDGGTASPQSPIDETLPQSDGIFCNLLLTIKPVYSILILTNENVSSNDFKNDTSNVFIVVWFFRIKTDEGLMVLVTIKEVAQKAGVSVSTVSRVLTNNAPVKPETREEVQEAIKQLGYSPNAVARSLRKKVSRTIGLVIPDITNPFFPDIAKGVEDSAKEAGYHVILSNVGNDPQSEEEVIQLLRERQVDGVILVSSSPVGTYLHKFHNEGMKIVTVDREFKDVEVDAVICDNVSGSYQATRHLIELGHQEIAIITGPMELNITQDRLEGYKKALREKGLPVLERWIWKAGFSFNQGYSITEENFEKENIPTAIFASSDIAAVAAISAIEKHGLKVPEDISVVGFDDIKLATLVKPTLTTVAQPTYEMGKQAVDLLVGGIKRGRKKAKRLVLPTKLVVRDSTDSRFKQGD